MTLGLEMDKQFKEEEIRRGKFMGGVLGTTKGGTLQQAFQGGMFDWWDSGTEPEKKVTRRPTTIRNKEKILHH